KEIKAEDEIEIFGKSDALHDVEEISTEKIDLSEMNESTETDVEIDFPEDVTAEEETVPVEIELEKTEELDDITIDVKGDTDKKVTFDEPEEKEVSVKATGLDDVMKDLEKSDLTASIDVSDLDEGEHEVDIDIEGPEGISFESQPERVKVNVEEESLVEAGAWKQERYELVRYLGAGGVRGVANKTLTPEIAYRLGRILG